MATALSEWLEGQPRGTQARIARKTGLTYQTVGRAKDGYRVHRETAELLSEATGGAVSVNDIPQVRTGKHRHQDGDDDDETRRVA